MTKFRSSNDLLWFLTEHEEDTGEHPDLYGREPLRLRGVGVDVVEDVDEDEEESDEERHAARHDVGGDEEADPGDHHEQARGQVVGDDVRGEVSFQSLQSGGQSGYQQWIDKLRMEK